MRGYYGLGFVAVCLMVPFHVLYSVETEKPSQELLDARSLDQLEFDALIATLDLTKTTYGLTALKRLTKPVKVMQEVCDRQRLLRTLANDTSTCELIDHALADIACLEASAHRYEPGGDPSFTRYQVIERALYALAQLKRSACSHELIGDASLARCQTIERALCAAAQSEDSVQLRRSSDSLLTKSGALYNPLFPARFNQSSKLLTLSYWSTLIGGIGVALVINAFEQWVERGLARLRNINANNAHAQLAHPSWGQKIATMFGINGLCRGLNIFSSRVLTTDALINRAADDSDYRNGVLESPESTAQDRMRAWLGALALNQGVPVPDQGSIINEFARLHPGLFRLNTVWASTLSTAKPSTQLVKFLFTIYSMGVHAKNSISLEHELWEHIRELTAWLKQVQIVAETVAPYRDKWDSADQLLQLLDDPNVQAFSDTANAFNQSWVKEYRWAHDPGRVLHVHYCAMQAAASLQRISEHIGVIDAWLSVVRVMQENELCDVEFVQADSATVRAYGLWNLIIGKERTVPNDVLLGDGECNKMLLTGPNGGGKSTVMKSIAQAVLLAQSWGLAPAHRFVLTFFDQIMVAMDSKQSLTSDLSTFMSELCTLETVKQTVQNCAASGSHCLILFDEPCRGTIECEAAQRITQLCQEIDPFDNALVILATHMYDPALAVDQLSLWNNWQLGYTFSDDGVRRTFELLPGIAHWWFTDAVKRAQFLKSLETRLFSRNKAPQACIL